MLRFLTVLLLCQLAGEIAATALLLPVPGPVLGMLLLFGLRLVRRRPAPAFDRFCRGLLQHLGLLFVPAGVGVVLHLELLAAAWAPIAAALIVGTAATMVVTGWLMQRLASPLPKPVGPDRGDGG